MKYNQFSNKGLETRVHPLAGAFESILEVDIDTSVVDPLQKTITKASGIKRLQRVLMCICNNSCGAIINTNYTSRKALVS